MPHWLNVTPFSDEHLAWCAALQKWCPLCKRVSITGWKVYDGEGRIKKWYRPFFLPEDSTQCPSCLRRWPIFRADFFPASLEAQGYVLESTDGVRLSNRPQGSEERIVDNFGSSTMARRTIKISRKWTQTCSVENESTWTNTSGATIGLDKLTSFKHSAEAKVREKYSVSEETVQTHEEELVVDVPPAKRIAITLYWKEIVQHGVVFYRKGDTRVGIPYSVTIGLTFDQEQRDIG